MKNNITFYETDTGLLISYNRDKNLYLLRNTLRKDKRISEGLFKTYKKQMLNRQNFSRKMNDWFRDIEVSWEYKGFWDKTPKQYRTVGNFNANEKTGQDIPKNYPRVETKFGYAIPVFHWGQVYLWVNYDNASRCGGRLLDVNTQEVLRWADLSNCSKIIEL